MQTLASLGRYDTILGMLSLDVIKTVARLLLRRGSRRSYGQFGEDAIIQTILKKSSGFYIDIGCYHPVLYSNTYGLYRRGWRGIAIDPNSGLAPLFRIFRHRDVFVNTAVGNGGTRTYHEFKDGAYNTLTTSEDIGKTRLTGTRDISVRPLAEIVQTHNVTQIDFLNIDVEGMDLEVLKSHNWNIAPRVIAVEYHIEFEKLELTELYKFLIEKKYRLYAFTGPTLIFLRSQDTN